MVVRMKDGAFEKICECQAASRLGEDGVLRCDSCGKPWTQIEGTTLTQPQVPLNHVNPRDRVALAALTGMLVGPTAASMTAEQMADKCYEYADAFIIRRCV